MVSGPPNGFSHLRPGPSGSGGPILPDDFSSGVRPSPALAELVEAIWDWDIPDGDMAAGFVQYRTLTRCLWQLGGDSFEHTKYGHVLTQTHSGTFAVRPCGPPGVITVRLKPEGAARLARASMRELMNVKIGLGNIFRSYDISLLEEQ